MKERNEKMSRSAMAEQKRDTRGSIRNFQEGVGGFDADKVASDDAVKMIGLVYFNDQSEKGYREQEWMVRVPLAIVTVAAISKMCSFFHANTYRTENDCFLWTMNPGVRHQRGPGK